VKWELGAFEKSGKDEEDTDKVDFAGVSQSGCGYEHGVEVPGAEDAVGEDEDRNEADVTEPADDELLSRGHDGGWTIFIELQEVMEAEACG
jgi:hypothetical protein